MLDNKLPGGQCGLGELLDKQLHAAVATWLSVFKFRTFNVDQSVYPSCSTPLKAASSVSRCGPVSWKGHSVCSCLA